MIISILAHLLIDCECNILSAIKSQCGTIHEKNLMQFLKKDKLSLEQKFAIQSSQILLTHVNHNDIVPTVLSIIIVNKIFSLILL